MLDFTRDNKATPSSSYDKLGKHSQLKWIIAEIQFVLDTTHIQIYNNHLSKSSVFSKISILNTLDFTRDNKATPSSSYDKLGKHSHPIAEIHILLDTTHIQI